MIDRDNIIRLYSEHSSQFDEKIGSLKNYDESYTYFLRNAKRNGNLLDLACGPGNVSAFIRKLKPEIEITCVDLSDNMLEIAKKKLVKGSFYKSDILDIAVPEKKYDLITCAFGIPYIESSEVGKFVDEVTRFAKKDTAVYISCMAGDEIAEDMMSFAENKKLAVQRHKKEDIIEEFINAGFTLADYRSQDYHEPDGSITTDMIFYFTKN